MKRFITFFLLVAMAIGGVRAQKGMQQVGVDIGVCSDSRMKSYTMLGGAVKYRYNFSDNFCIEPMIQLYYGRSVYDNNVYSYFESESWNQIGVNGIYFFGIPRIWRPFIGVGLTYGTYKYKYNNNTSKGEYYSNYTKENLVPLFILGIDRRLSYRLSIHTEAKIGYGGADSEFCPLMANIGLTYNF